MADPEDLYGETQTIQLAGGEDVEVDLGVLQEELHEKTDCILGGCTMEGEVEKTINVGEHSLVGEVCYWHQDEGEEGAVTMVGLDLPIWRFWSEDEEAEEDG